MKEILETLFSHPFMAICTFIFVAVCVKMLFTFIVEIIHGKANIFNLPEGTKIENPNENKVNLKKPEIKAGKVEVRKNGKN